MGLPGLSASDLYMRIALSQAEALCKNSKVDCIFTPRVKSLPSALQKEGEKGGVKPVDIILKTAGQDCWYHSFSGLPLFAFRVTLL